MTFEFTLFMIFSLYPLVFLLGEKGWDNTIERYLSFKSILPTEYFVPRFLWTTFISVILIYSAPSMWANNYEYQDYITGHEYVYSLPEKRQALLRAKGRNPSGHHRSQTAGHFEYSLPESGSRQSSNSPAAKSSDSADLIFSDTFLQSFHLIVKASYIFYTVLNCNAIP